MERIITAVAIAFMVVGPAAVAAPESQQIQASPAQLMDLADRLVRSNQSAGAKAVFAVLGRNPNADIRNEARFREAKLLVTEGQTSQAAILLRQILDNRPNATLVRLELAQILDKMGDKEGAWRQVRAIHASGLPTAVARLVDRYSEALRAQRAFGASFEITVAPDSNINRATRSDTLGTIIGDFEISDDGKAKSGTGMSLHGQTYRRWSLSDRANLLVRLSGFADLYKQKEFNDVAADVAVGPELSVGQNRIQLELGATQRWYGQHPFMRTARIAATASRPLGRRALLRLSGSAALIDNQLNDLQDGKIFSGQVSIERALTATMGVAANASIDRQSLKDAAYSTTGWRAGMTGWRDFGRLTLTVGVELGRLRADERLALFPEMRLDRYSRFTIGATFRQLQLRGFSPVLRLSVERNRSSVEFYDYGRTRTEVGIARAF